MNTPIIFNLSIGSRKPHSGVQKVCPFCHPEKLTNVIEQEGDLIWLMNKFPVLKIPGPQSSWRRQTTMESSPPTIRRNCTR